jgi:hypothetical protein
MQGDNAPEKDMQEGPTDIARIHGGHLELVSYLVAIGTLPLDIGNGDLLVIAVLGPKDRSQTIL